MIKAIDSILCIDSFEQLFVLIKGTLQSPRLEDHMKTIGIDQSLSNMSSFEQIFLNNIKNIYQHVGKCDDKKKLKDVLDAAMLSTQKTKCYEITLFIHHHI